MPVLLCGMLAASLVTARAGLVTNTSMAILAAGLLKKLAKLKDGDDPYILGSQI